MWAVAIAVFILGIGTPLLGLRTFHGADLLLDRYPWRTAPPGVTVASNPLVQDTVSTFMPLHAELRRRVAGGDLPLWTPYPGGGLPLLTVPDAGALGPLNMPYRLLPLWYAPAVSKLAELLVAMGFTSLFLRRVGMGRPAALAGGLIYAMSGFQVVWTNWPQTHVGALIPVLFWAVERGIRVGGIRGALPIAPVVAAMVFEGFPSVAGYATVAAGTYAVCRVALDRSVGRRASALGPLVAAAVVGFGLTALQALPLADRAAELDLGYRVQGPDSHLPPMTAATLAIPDAFGTSVDGSFFGPLNYAEIQSFIGASSLVLIAAAAAWRTRRPISFGARGFLWSASASCAVFLYVGGPLLALFQITPLFELNFVTRLRSVFGFLLACLAALGLQVVLDRPRVTPRAIVVWAGAAIVGALGLWRLWVVAEGAGQTGYVTRQALVPLGAGALAVAAVALSSRVRLRGHALVLWVVPVLFAVEALAFAIPWWPRIPRDRFYPTTPAHRAVAEHLGRDRILGAGGALAPGTLTYYGIRSLTTNNTLPQLPTWEDLIRAVDPEAYAASPVYPSVRPTEELARSPILDRMGVRYVVVPPTVPVFGRREVVTAPAAGTVTLRAGEALTANLPGGPTRAVVVRLARTLDVAPVARLTARFLDPSGTVLGEGFRLLHRGQGPGPVEVPVVEPCAAAIPCPPRLVLELRLAAARGTAVLQRGEGDGLALTAVIGADDGLRVEIVENVVGYRRLGSLPRIRWASSAVVIEDPAERIRLLAAGLDPSGVVLSAPGPAGSGEPATIRVVEDSGDRLVTEVEADGVGYLVAADPLGHGWEASVDGRPADIRPADHAGVAVLVPAGPHRVELRFAPPGWRLGLGISFVSLILVGVGLRYARSRRPLLPPEIGDGSVPRP